MLEHAKLEQLFTLLGTPAVGGRLVLQAREQAPVCEVRSTGKNVITLLAIPEGPTAPLTAEQKLVIEQAGHIGHLLAAMSASSEAGPAFMPDIESFHQGGERLIGDMDGGVAAHFARRLGVRKSTVHYWRTGRTPLTLDALVRMAMHCGVSLPSLLQGKLSDWCLPPTTQQLALQLDYPASNQHRPKRQHDWGAIRRSFGMN